MKRGGQSKWVEHEHLPCSRSFLTTNRIQITKRIRRTLQKAIVQHTVAERKNWAKFGQEKGNKPGPDRTTTTVGETVQLKLSAGNKVCSTGHFQEFSLLTHLISVPRARADGGRATQGLSCEGGCWKDPVPIMQGTAFHLSVPVQGYNRRIGGGQWYW